MDYEMRQTIRFQKADLWGKDFYSHFNMKFAKLFLSSSNEFLKQKVIHFVLEWHFYAILAQVIMLSSYVFVSVTPRTCSSKINNTVCNSIFTRIRNGNFCRNRDFIVSGGLLCITSPLLLGQAIFQNVYRKSFYSSTTFLIPPLVFFFHLEVDQVSCGCTITHLPYIFYHI